MTYERVVQRLSKEHSECIECGKPYDGFLGGIVWDGKNRQYFICGTCAHYIVPALVNDYANLISEQMSMTVQHPVKTHVSFKPFQMRARLGYFKRVVEEYEFWGIGKEEGHD